MSIDAGAQVAIILLAFGPCVVIVNLLGQVCSLGRAPCTKETLPDFHEWCRVSTIILQVDGLSTNPRVWGVTQVAIILLAYGPYVVIVNCWDMFCTFGRVPSTKETLPDFCKWCRVTRHSRDVNGFPSFRASQNE